MEEFQKDPDEIDRLVESVQKKLNINVQVQYHPFSDSYTLRVRNSNFPLETKEEVIEALNKLGKT